MVIYIKIISNNNVQLGGTVANQEMLDDGWVRYNGNIPELKADQVFGFANGSLIVFNAEIAPLTQVQNYKDYLAATDFKMLPGYIPKEDEDIDSIKSKRDLAREYIRANDTTRRELNITPTANTVI